MTTKTVEIKGLLHTAIENIVNMNPDLYKDIDSFVEIAIVNEIIKIRRIGAIL